MNSTKILAARRSSKVRDWGPSRNRTASTRCSASPQRAFKSHLTWGAADPFGEAYAVPGSCRGMDLLVTGATGFVGANVARLLIAEGQRVRVLARPASSLEALSGCPVEIFRGNILDPETLAPALAGCGLVFHVAADYRLWAKDAGEIYRNNVDGTRTVLEACERAGVGRVVYTSSIGTIGHPRDGGPGTETTPVALTDMIGDYKRSKFLAERVAEEFASHGLPVVIVNPSNPIG